MVLAAMFFLDVLKFDNTIRWNETFLRELFTIVCISLQREEKKDYITDDAKMLSNWTKKPKPLHISDRV